jgi:hypothetical protein
MEIKEKRQLVDDRGKLLIFLIKRLSIPRHAWVHTYCYDGNNPKSIPTQKWKRKTFLAPYIEKLLDFISLNSPCTIVGMGKLAMECMLGDSLLKKKAGTYWRPNIPFTKLGVERVWITRSPDAALFNPELAVSLSRCIGKAALEANIDIKIDYTLPMFDFSNYHQLGTNQL